jgi:hypothetical protein
MTKPVIRLSLIVTCFLFIAASNADAVSWKSVGSGSLKGIEKFDVFIDTDSIRRENGKVTFWQGHVFYSEQTLPTGKPYVRVSMERVVDCTTNTASTLEAVFYGSDGSIVDRYAAGRDVKFDTVSAGSISGAVFNYICGSDL